jgi:Tfp pilus assembly protein PilF
MPTRHLWIGGLLVAIGVALGFAVLRHRPESPSAAPTAEFVAVMNRGNGLLENGDATAAIAAYAQALRLSPESVDVRLNLAIAHLRANQPVDAETFCRQALALDPNNAAAHYLLGCALLRDNQPGPAAEAFQQSWKIEPGVPALDFQMGLAQQQLGHTADAIRLFEGVVQAQPDHPSAHFQLSQLYRRTGRAEDAARALAEHQRVMGRSSGAPIAATDLERCQHTQPLAPFLLAQPDRPGIAVRFADDTATVLGAPAAEFRGPLAVIDHARDGRASLFAQARAGGFSLLDNRDGRLAPLGRPVRVPATSGYRTALAGDLDNDGLDDVVVLGEQDSRVFKLYEQGRMRDATRAVGLEGLKASGGLLADLDFTGNLDLLTVQPDGSGLGLHRNLGNFFFDTAWNDSGLPRPFPGATQVSTIDWDNEGLPGVFVARAAAPPAFFAKKRAAAFTASPATDGWPAASIMEVGDIDNDLRPEAILATPNALEIIDRERNGTAIVPLNGFAVSGLLLADYDNDGWLDLLAWGTGGVRVWRNGGHAGFAERTAELGLGATAAVDGVVAADFDDDGDSDLVTSSDAGLRFWRNDGGNQNCQFKLRLAGNRSNTSALGVRVEVLAGDWRTSRTVRGSPLEIGVGRHEQLDALRVRWFDLSTAQVDVPVGRTVHTVAEPTLPSGSCPYLYAWDGTRFAFVTDMLGAAPLGLPMNERMFVFADPDEYLALGNTTSFPPRDGAYELRLTEELREVLYLDEARLVAIDHPAGTVVHPTSKMLPGPPFPKHELRTLLPLAAPRQAVRSDGLDVTAEIAAVDARMVAPVQVRRAQVRGLAEPYAVTIDFGPLPVERPLVLALTGWIRFGGGMANISGSLDPTLPFPFPALEAELADGTWQKVDVVVGTPAGKTKTILVDLAGKLPAGARRLRLSTAFEIYWDAAQLCEPATGATSLEHVLTADRSDLRWRGYSRYAAHPASQPLTPIYDDVSPIPPWDRTPGGWFTRYGPVDELIAARDDRLALLAAGDELALSFDAARLPPLAPGMERHFFLWISGWDKDADFHVATGWQVDPLPFHGMDDQAYGREPRPARLDDRWIQEYNTRWVAPVVPHPAGPPRAAP